MEEKQIRLVHFTIVDGSVEDIKNLGDALNEAIQKYNLPFQALVTNQRIELTDTKFLLDNLYTLYKKYKAVKEAKTVK